MNSINKQTIDKLHKCRESLINIPKSQLSGAQIIKWLEEWNSVFERADSIADTNLWVFIDKPVRGFEDETDTEVCLDIRNGIVEILDVAIAKLDSTQVIKPILEQLILRVKDDKLATLLKEFNDTRIDQPNLAASGFRTILPLIIRERARQVDPSHVLATKDDIGFEQDINAAIKHGSLFNQAETKLIKRYLSGGNKDSFDNVVHKPVYLIDKSELDGAVDILNRLLPTIVS